MSIYHFINNLQKNIEINLFYVTDQYPQKYQKTSGFLIFLGRIERNQWLEIGKEEHGLNTERLNSGYGIAFKFHF